MSSMYGEVPDNNFSLSTLSIIYFWKPQAKSSSMNMNPTVIIMILTSGLLRISSMYGEVPDNNFSLNTKSVIYFWNPQAKSTSMKITLTFMITIRNVSITEDVLPSMGRFLTTIAQLSINSSSRSSSNSNSSNKLS